MRLSTVSQDFKSNQATPGTAMTKHRTQHPCVTLPSRFMRLLRGTLTFSRFSLGLFALWIVSIYPELEAAQPATSAPHGYEMTFPSMGSSVTLSAYSTDEERVSQAFDEAKSEIDRLVHILSDYEPESELNRLHRSAGVPTKLSRELFEVLVSAEDWYQASNGGFDVAIGNLTRLWRESRKAERIPTAAEVEQARVHSGWQLVELDRQQQQLLYRDPAVRLDLGGIAAGFIVDRAFAILQSHGLKSCLINAGGDIRCGDPPPGREGWRIEVASPQRGGPGWRRIHLANAAITTSGDLWQYSQVDGKRRSHILNPKDGYGVEGPLSITVIASQCLDADAAATALCVMGAEPGYRWIQQHAADYQGLWLQSAIDDETHLVWISDRFPPPLDQP